MHHMCVKIHVLLHEIVDGRLKTVRKGEASSYGHDLLGRMLTAATVGGNEQALEFNRASVIQNCMRFYFAGQDTVANATLFTMLTLALHPQWQDPMRSISMPACCPVSKWWGW